MAVNKNFVVKNGLEVDTNTLFVDSAINRVAIGTTVPTATLDVRGKILSDSQIDSWNGNFIGIVTAGAVGVTTMTALDAVVTGFSTLGLANATSLNVTTGFSTVQALSSKDLTVSIGATVSKDLNVGLAATVGAALTVSGSSKLQDVQVGSALTVIGVSTFTGNATFAGNVDIAGDLTYDEMNARNLNISGIATLGFATAGNAYVAGITTTNLLNVGFGATMVKVQGVPATRVGINSVNPAFTLDVDGDSNVTGTARQGGTSIVELATGDATALAIALG